jgi:hypothetical protein
MTGPALACVLTGFASSRPTSINRVTEHRLAMILSETSPEIRAAPETLFAFFQEMETNYTRWHPDHLLFRWIDPPALKPGVRFYFEERIAGKLLKKKVTFSRIELGSLIEFAPTSRLFRLFLPRISFTVTRAALGFTISQDISLRIGPLAAKLNRRELDAVRVHMREEGENLKLLLERSSRQ